MQLPALVLLDEVGTGTDPNEGGALATAIVQHFRQRGALVIATTHFDSVKTWGIGTEGVAVAAFAFDPQNFAPTYRLIYGAPGTALRELRWVARDGQPSGPASEPLDAWDLRIAPDGRRVVTTEVDRQFRTLDVFIRTGSQPAPLRLSLSADVDESGVWSPDGLRIAWAGQRRKVRADRWINAVRTPLSVRHALAGAAASRAWHWRHIYIVRSCLA